MPICGLSTLTHHQDVHDANIIGAAQHSDRVSGTSLALTLAIYWQGWK